MPSTRRLVLIIIVLFLLLLFLVVPGVSWSQDPSATAQAAPPSAQTPATTAFSPWQDSAREFAKKIVALTGPRQTVALTVRNISTLSDAEVAAVRAALESELRAAGLRLAAKTNSAPELRITLSENLQSLLWIAELLRNDSREVGMISVPKTSVTAPATEAQIFALQSKLIFEQEERILQFALLEPERPGARSKLLILEPARLALYQSENNHWTAVQSALIAGPAAVSRDPRGNFELINEEVAVFLSGMVCRGTIRPTLSLQCSATDAKYPASVVEREGATLGWGSQLAGMRTACGRGSQLLATRPGDWTEPDSVQAFEVVGSQAVAVSLPLSFPGPVLNLSSGVEPQPAGAIVRNLKTGHYEVYTLTITCGR